MNIVFQTTPLNLIFLAGLWVSLTEVLCPQSASSVAPLGGGMLGSRLQVGCQMLGRTHMWKARATAQPAPSLFPANCRTGGSRTTMPSPAAVPWHEVQMTRLIGEAGFPRTSLKTLLDREIHERMVSSAPVTSSGLVLLRAGDLDVPPST